MKVKQITKRLENSFALVYNYANFMLKQLETNKSQLASSVTYRNTECLPITYKQREILRGTLMPEKIQSESATGEKNFEENCVIRR